MMGAMHTFISNRTTTLANFSIKMSSCFLSNEKNKCKPVVIIIMIKNCCIKNTKKEEILCVASSSIHGLRSVCNDVMVG